MENIEIIKLLDNFEKKLETMEMEKKGFFSKNYLKSEDIIDFIEEIRLKLPAEISKAHYICENNVEIEKEKFKSIEEMKQSVERLLEDAKIKETQLLNDAKRQAELIENTARENAKLLVDEHTIVLEAKQKAYMIIENAKKQSAFIFNRTLNYSNEVMGKILSDLKKYENEIINNGEQMNHYVEQIVKKYENESFNKNYE